MKRNLSSIRSLSMYFLRKYMTLRSRTSFSRSDCLKKKLIDLSVGYRTTEKWQCEFWVLFKKKMNAFFVEHPMCSIYVCCVKYTNAVALVFVECFIYAHMYSMYKLSTAKFSKTWCTVDERSYSLNYCRVSGGKHEKPIRMIHVQTYLYYYYSQKHMQ